MCVCLEIEFRFVVIPSNKHTFFLVYKDENGKKVESVSKFFLSFQSDLNSTIGDSNIYERD